MRLRLGTSETAAATGAERADDGLRTRDLQLGKLALYQLSYVRVERYITTTVVALFLP